MRPRRLLDPRKPGRRTRTRRLTGPIAAALALLALPLAGCTSLTGAPQSVDHAGLMNDLASTIDSAGSLTYSADYQLPLGATARIAQTGSPHRTAYTFPDGKLTLTSEATTDCTTRKQVVTCTMSMPAASPAALAGAGRRGLAPPEVVAGLLTAAAIDSAALVEQHDSTIAGQHATCVEVRGTASFTACVTTDGVLASFTGRVADADLDVVLTRYRDSVDSDAFEVPAGATVVARRTLATPAPTAS